VAVRIPDSSAVREQGEHGVCNHLLIIVRETFAPDVDTAQYPPFFVLKSVHNIVIESFWHWLRQKTGINLKDYILRGREDGTFQSNVNFHRCVFIHFLYYNY
jgi:hypothetical protein